MLGLLSSIPGAIAQGLVWGLMAIGVYVTYKVLDIADLTVDGSICTGAAVCTMLIISGVSPYVALLAAFASGCIAGAITGLLHILLGIPSILAGILTQMSLWSINLKILGKANQSLPARSYNVLLTQLNNVRSIVVLLIITFALIGLLYMFFGSEIGCAVRATGCNDKMSRAQGINTNVMKILGLALSNGIVAFAGGLLCQYQGFADINMGRGAVVIGLAAVVIGSAIIRHIGTNFALKLLGVSLGAIVYYLVYQVIIFTGFDTDLLKMLSAVVVAAFLGVPYVRKKIRSKKRAG